MKVVIQRVKQAQVKVSDQIIGEINKGLLIFLAVAHEDGLSDIDWLVRKITQLRIFEDTQGKMNLSAQDVQAEFLVVSQFTLLGDCVKGRRPSFDQAASPEKAEEFYNIFVTRLRDQQFKVQTGQFRAMMEVSLINDGPVTLILDSLSVNREM